MKRHMFESKSQLVKESFHPHNEHIEGNKKLERLYNAVLNKFKETNKPVRLQLVKQVAQKHNIDFVPVLLSFTELDSIPDGLTTGTYRGEECVAPNSFWKEFNTGNGRRANDAVNRAERAINDIQADKRLSIEDWLKKHIQKISFELPSGHLRSKYPGATFKAEKELERTFLNRQEKFANDFELFNFKTGLDFTSKDNREILPNVYVTWRNIDEKTKEANPKYYDDYWNIVGTITFDTEIKNAPDEVILEMEKAKAKSKDEKSRTLNKNTNVISSNAFCQEVFQLFGNSFDFLRNKNNNRIQERFRMVEKKNLTEQFMSIHEKSSTRFNKNLKKVYEMLDKYGTEKEDVDKVFNRATLKEKLEMVKLLKEGSSGYLNDGQRVDKIIEILKPKYPNHKFIKHFSDYWDYPYILVKTKNEYRDYENCLFEYAGDDVGYQRTKLFYKLLDDIVALFEEYGLELDTADYYDDKEKHRRDGLLFNCVFQVVGSDIHKVFNTANLKEKLETVKLLEENTSTEGMTVVQLSIAQEEPYYDCGALCGIYEEDVILPDSKVDAFIADLTKYCKKIKRGDIYDEIEDWDIYDCFEDDLYDICEKHGAKTYSKKKGDKVSIETFEYDLY